MVVSSGQLFALTLIKIHLDQSIGERTPYHASFVLMMTMWRERTEMNISSFVTIHSPIEHLSLLCYQYLMPSFFALYSSSRFQQISSASCRSVYSHNSRETNGNKLESVRNTTVFVELNIALVVSTFDVQASNHFALRNEEVKSKRAKTAEKRERDSSLK